MTLIEEKIQIPLDVDEALSAYVPDQDRPDFIVEAIQDALALEKRNQLLELLKSSPKYKNPEGISTETIFRKLRSSNCLNDQRENLG